MRCEHNEQDHFEKMRAHMLEHLSRFINNEDIQGIELVSLIRVLANYFSAFEMRQSDFRGLSGPRMGILLHLFTEDENGNPQGINPTRLSQYRHVKKNTISSLLRALEESGLVERTPDPQDKRAFMIRITQAGRDWINTMGPKRLKMINDLSSGLTSDEKGQLISLLEKLRKSIRTRMDFPAEEMHSHRIRPFRDDLS